MRRWTSWAWGGSCDKPIAEDESTGPGAVAAGLDRAQAEETPASGSAAPLKKVAHINQGKNFFTLAQDTDMLCFQP